ncbi:hypothetical protein BC827DRAFT_863329 [Russula dissimulans]|nr:hypothetical protein BC827DRAFT_863329 [Russula dissimulans]
MASDDLDIPQIAVFDTSQPLPTAHPQHGHLSPPTPILKSTRNSLGPIVSSASHRSETETSSSQLPAPPTLTANFSGSIRFATSTALRHNNPEERDGLPSLHLTPHSQDHRRKSNIGTVSSIGNSSTERHVEDKLTIRLIPLPSAHSDAITYPPSHLYLCRHCVRRGVASSIRYQFLQRDSTSLSLKATFQQTSTQITYMHLIICMRHSQLTSNVSTKTVRHLRPHRNISPHHPLSLFAV